MFWNPQPTWAGEDAYLIGGGSSLKGFDFNTLKGKHVLGCNDAAFLGPEIVEYCIFCDSGWFNKNKEFAQAHFSGRSITNSPTLLNLKAEWLLQMHRVKMGLHEDGHLGFNYSTGAAAINLAVVLGATRVFLLGYDLCRNGEGQSHWHDKNPKITQDRSFERFQLGFAAVRKDLPRYPLVQVWNVTDGSSRLECFEKLSFQDFLNTLK